MHTKPALDAQDVATLLRVATEEALRNAWKVSIAVCDDGGHLLGFVRLDGATPASAAISQAKARTAAQMRRETKGVEEMINQGRTSFLSVPGIEGMLEGGLPIVVDGHTIGAVGVSGVQSPQDAQVARAGITALQLG